MISIKEASTNDKFLLKVLIAERATNVALTAAWKEVGTLLTNKLQYMIRNGPRTGRVYTFRGRKHQASAPGEVPANRTGRLAKSVGYEATGHHTLQFGEEAEYAGWLENGTKKMAPRPHLSVAVNEMQTVTMQTLIKFIAEAYK
jgi:HK97 gp10 family phage protein